MVDCFDCLEPCWDFVRGLFVKDEDYLGDRANFEQTVKFLDSVPLFKQQLPKSELPVVAQHLTRKLWLPGQTLVRQGDVGRAFFLIQSGEAMVVTNEDGGQQVRCVLMAGDYFGGHTLTTERPNVASILCGEQDLVTLSMSRKEFEVLGLSKWLEFPKRPALYGEMDALKSSGLGAKSVADSLAEQGEELPEEEINKIKEAIKANANLRALMNVSEDKMEDLARGACKMEVGAGQEICKAGSISQEFFIVRSGRVMAAAESFLRGDGQQSAENAVAHSTMAERLLRKQHFLLELAARTNTKHLGKNPKSTVSMFTPNGLPPAATSSAARKKKKFQSTLQMPEATGRLQMPEATGRRVTEAMGTLDASFARQSSAAEANNKDTETRRNKNRALERYRSRSNIDSGNYPAEQVPDAGAVVSAETELSEGDSFGELSILYNMHMHATFKAVDDCTVYAIRRRNFTAAFNRKGKRFQEIVSLMEEVALLAPLLSAERWELACSNTGFVDFRPDERVLHQGRVRETRKWYIIFSGSAVVRYRESEDSSEEVLATLTRGAHFGERSLLRNDANAPVNVDSGPEGMCCLTFHGEETCMILRKVMDSHSVPSVQSNIREWWARKAKGFRIDQAASPSGGDDEMAMGHFRSQHCVGELTDLSKICILGKGGYGQVCLVKDQAGHRYALKVLSKGHIQQQGAERLVSWERELMTMVSSPFVIRLHRTFKDPQFVYFLLEAALGGSLVSVLQYHPEVFSTDAPRGSSMAFYVGCITNALEHLHERRIVHRDLKPENVLLDEAGYAKVCDLGFARFVLSRTNTLAGTPEYMAPEMIDFPHTHGHAVDWWALGVLSWELLAGQTPFQDEGICDPVARLLAIRRSQELGLPPYTFSFPAICKPFVSRLLLKNPNERIGAGPRGAEEVREQPFWKAIKFDHAALQAQTLPSPYQKAWADPADATADGSDFRDNCQLGLAPNDSIFMQYTPNDKDWDSKF